MPPDAHDKRLARACLVALIAAGLALRLWGANWGLPDVLNPDEMPILNRAMALRLHAKPENVLYPALYFYVLFVWEGLFFLLGRLVGWYGSLSAFTRAYFVDPSAHVLAARVLGGVFGALTIPATWALGRRVASRPVGLIAALFIAVAPYAVRDAHYVKLDVPVTLFVTLSLAWTASIVVDPARAERSRTWVAAGLFAGLAISTQYYAVFVTVPIGAAAIVDARRTGDWAAAARRLALAAAATVVAFLAASPFFLSSPHEIAVDFAELRKVDIAPATNSGAFASAGLYARLLAEDALGWPVFVLAGVGALLAAATDRTRAIALLTFPAVYFAFVANTHPSSRYLNAMLPATAVVAAYGLWRLAAAARSRRAIAAAVLALLAAGPGLAASVRWNRFFERDDTRTLARQFVERTIPAGSTVLVQPHGVELRPSRAALVEALGIHLGSSARASAKFQAMLSLDPYPAPSYRVLYLGSGGVDVDKIYVSPAADANALAALHVDYVIVTGTPGLGTSPLVAALPALGQPIATFSPTAPGTEAPPFLHNTADRLNPLLERPGPTIEIWRLQAGG